MPAVLTEITEIVTGLGMSGADDLATVIEAPECPLRNVDVTTWDRIRAAYADGEHPRAFAEAWANGRTFFNAADGLRGRVPRVIEWKGPHRQPGYDTLPADLRVDHVYLISCKYQSKILSNSSPSNLFQRRLGERTSEPCSVSWYEEVAPEEYRSFYADVRRFMGTDLLPERPGGLSDHHVRAIRDVCGGSWPEPLRAPWAELSLAVARESARRWEAELNTSARREEMLWRLLRLGAAPYFVLGSSPDGPVRLRIGTPWDWRQNFRLNRLSVTAASAGQPLVRWSADLTQSDPAALRRVEGHVEIRWSHGRFSTVEAKVYLDTPHAQVPGYFPLDLGDVAQDRAPGPEADPGVDRVLDTMPDPVPDLVPDLVPDAVLGPRPDAVPGPRPDVVEQGLLWSEP